MASRRRHVRRRSWDYNDAPITIRVGSRRSSRRYHETHVSGPRDGARFARLVDEQVSLFPRDPLIIQIDGHQPWLGDVLSTCIDDYWDQISDLSRELQFAKTAQFPEKASKRAQYVPWTFIVDHINVPQVYYWSVGLEPPESDDEDLPDVRRYKMRVGVWFCARNACTLDRQVSTVLIFTQSDPLSEHVASELLFENLYRHEDFDQPREDEEGVCWIFNQLYWLLTDWQNVIQEVNARLDEAELNSHGHRDFPVKLRTRTLHTEVSRIFQLKEYLRFHSRSFKKLQKLKNDVPKNEQNDSLWDDMDDSVEDLDQYDATMDSLKERFNNLLDLEFNIQNADQSDDSSFLTTIATLFLPISFLTSLWGITTTDWSVAWFAYTAVPVFVVSVAFLLIFPWAVHRWQKIRYPVARRRISLKPRDFTMLGDELPDNVDVPGGRKPGKAKHKAQRPNSGRDQSKERGPRSRSRSRAEKDGSY